MLGCCDFTKYKPFLQLESVVAPYSGILAKKKQLKEGNGFEPSYGFSDHFRDFA